MYICPNCGKEFKEEVAFCSDCGTKVILKAPVEVAPANAIKPEEPFVLTLLSFLSTVVQLISAFFVAVALATPYVYVRIRSSYSSSLSTTFNPGEGSSVFAFLFAIGGLALSVVSFVLTMKRRPELKTMFNKITAMVSGMLLFIVGIVLLAQM